MSAPVDGAKVYVALRNAMSSMGEERVNGILESLRKKGIAFDSGQFVLQQLEQPLTEIVGSAVAKVLVAMVADELKRG